jgi:phage terminase large subunit-like protein
VTGRPRKTLEHRVFEGVFYARKPEQAALLLGPPVRWPNFAHLQARYQATTSAAERRQVALEFERLVRAAHSEARRRNGDNDGVTAAAGLAAALAELGRHGSANQLLEFFPTFLVHPKGPLMGQPFRLAPFQKQFLREFYRRDERGRRVYRHGVLGLSRGSGKTPLAAALGVYELISRSDGPEVYAAACSREQAGIALGFARSFVEDGPLREWVQLKSGLICPATRGTMKVISSEGRMQHGRMPAVALIDELWAFETAREQQTYTALSSALHKREDAYLLAITTAGYDRDSLLGRIHEQALSWPQIEILEGGYLTVAKDEENGQLFWWYGAPEGAAIDDPAVWRAANPAAWIKTAELKRQLADPGLDELEFRRLNLNQWTSVRDAWLPNGVWAGLRSEQKIPKGADVYIGVDVGIYHDTTAVCWAHVLEDGRILIRSKVWAADEKAAAHAHIAGGRVRLEDVENFILETLVPHFRVREVAYDPAFFRRSAELLDQSGLTTVEFMQASGPMAEAYHSFYQLALEGKLTHNGDPVLAAHIESTAASKSERGWRLRKLKNNKHIDATVAAVLAVARAQHHKPTAGPQIFWMDA